MKKSLFGLRLVLQAASLVSWPVCLWSFSRAGRSSSGHGKLLPSCWPFQHFSSPSACSLGLTTLHTSVVLSLGSSSPSLSCRTSGKWMADPKRFPSAPPLFWLTWLRWVLALSFGRSDMYLKRLQICVFLLVFSALLSALVILFYVYPVKCDWCEYLTCIPITDMFCEKYDLNARFF